MTTITEAIEWIKDIKLETIVDIAIAVGIIILFKIISSTVAYIIIKMVNFNKSKRKIKESGFYKPIKIFTVLIGVYLAILILRLPEDVMNFANKVFRIALIILIANGVANLINPKSTVFTKIKGKLNTDDTLSNFISKVIKTIVYIIAGFIVINEIGYDLSGIVTGLGLSGVVFALAAQDIAKNLFGGFAIIVDKPFIVGDWVETEGASGTVEDITFRSTKIRTTEDTVVTIPNSVLSNQAIVNAAKREKRKYEMKLEIQADTSLDKIKILLDKINLVLRSNHNIYQDSINVHMNEIIHNYIEILVTVYSTETEYSKYLDVKEDINYSIMEIIKNENIKLAQDLRMYKEEK